MKRLWWMGEDGSEGWDFDVERWHEDQGFYFPREGIIPDTIKGDCMIEQLWAMKKGLA